MRNTRPQDIPYGCPYLALDSNLFGLHEELARYVVQEDDWREPEEGDDSPRARAYNAIFPTSPLNPPKGQFYELDIREPVEFRYGPNEYSQEDYLLFEHPEYGLFVVVSFGGYGGAEDRIIWMEMPWDDFVRLCDESGPRWKYGYTRHESGGTWWYNRSTYPWEEVLSEKLDGTFEWVTEEEWLKYRHSGKPVESGEKVPEGRDGLDDFFADLEAGRV